MSFLKNIALVAGGIATGYLFSRVSGSSKDADSSANALARREQFFLQKRSEGEQAMAHFFDSPLGHQIQPLVLKSFAFAARVKRGMDEREAELKSRLENQKRSERPGTMNGWDLPENNRSRLGEAEVLDADFSIASETAGNDSLHNTHRRVTRDQELGKDFFA